MITVGRLDSRVAQAAPDTRTKVYKELIYLRVLADLDEPHIRLLRLNSQMEATGRDPVRQWHPSDLGQADPGVAEEVWPVLPVLDRYGLISRRYEVLTRDGREPEYTITPYGEWFVTMLAESE